VKKRGTDLTMNKLSYYRIQTWIKQAIKYIILLTFLVFVILPIYWVIVTSLKAAPNVVAWPPQWIPNPVSFESYATAFRLLPIGRFFLNSIIIAVALMISNVVLCSMAGYTFARKRFWGRDVLFALVLSSMMVPLHIRIIPMYMVALKFGLDNTYAGIVLPIAATGFGIFMMRQFFLTLPMEVEDAARVDGCGEWGVIFRIVVPMSRPAIISLGLFALVWSLEDFLWPLIITSTTAMRPLPVGITLFIGLVVYEWGSLMAVTTLAIVPMIIVFMLLQRQFVRGLTAGAVKG
jgi:ABC-type glycerol-3-phosphate transport system permease component